MAKRSANVRNRIYTNSAGNDVFKTTQHQGSPYHSQEKSTGKIRSQGIKATEARGKPTVTKGSVGGGGGKVPATRPNTSVGTANKMPVKARGVANRVLKNMGDAKVVAKKAISAPKAVSFAGKAASLGMGAVASAVVGNSMERSSHLISTGKLKPSPLSSAGLYNKTTPVKKTLKTPAMKPKMGNVGLNLASEYKAQRTAPSVKKTAPTAPKVTATSNWKSQTAAKAPVYNMKAPKATSAPAPAKKAKFSAATQKSLTWLQNGDW